MFHTIKSLTLKYQQTKPHVLYSATEKSLFALWEELKDVPLEATHGPILQLHVGAPR